MYHNNYKRKKHRHYIFMLSTIIFLITMFMFSCICIIDNTKQQKFEVSDNFETTVKDIFEEN